MTQYFPKPYEAFAGNINVRVDLSNYATKDDIKNITHVDTSSFALKTNLANLKREVDKLDVDKLKPILTDLSKLRDVIKNDVVKKTDYNTLVTKVDNIDTSGLVKKTDYNTKITEIEDKIPDISSLATKTTLATVKNKIPDISNLVKKTDFDKTKYIFIAKQLSFLHGKSYFDEDGRQNYLVFLPMIKHFKLNSIVNVVDRVLSWPSKRISNESIKPPTTSDNSLNPKLSYYGTKIRVQFTGNCLKQSKVTFTHKNVVNIYIVYELAASSSHTTGPTIKKLFIWSSYFNKKC